MSAYVYILECADGRYYTGSTRNLEERLDQHHSGKGSVYTKTRLPIKLIYVEEFENVGDAFYREKQIQGWNRKKKEALIAEDFNKLVPLSRNKSVE